MKKTIILFALFTLLPILISASDKKEATKLIDRGNVLINKNAGQAIALFKKAYEMGLKNDDNALCALALDRYAWCMQLIGEDELAITLFYNALNYCPSNKTDLLTDIKTGLGSAYGSMNKIEKGKQFLYEALYLLNKKSKNLKTYMNLGRLYSNLGNLFVSNGEVVNGKYYYKKSLDYGKLCNDKLNECRIYLNLGTIGNDYAARVSYLKRAITMALKIEDYGSASMAYANLSDCYFFLKRFVDAKQAVQMSDEYSEDNTNQKYQNLKRLVQIYDAQNEIAIAYSYQKQAINVIEKLKETKENEEVEYKITNSQLMKLRDQNELQKKENKIYKERNYILSAGIVLLLVALAAGYRFYGYRRKKQAELMQKQYDLEKAQNKVMELEVEKKESMLNSINNELQSNRDRISSLRYFLKSRNELLGNIHDEIKIGYKLTGSEQVVHYKKLCSYIQQYQYKEEKEEQKKEEEQDAKFVRKLKGMFPEITDGECNLALYVRASLSSKEIALLTGIQTKSIEMNRYRLRKVLGLERNENITEFLRSI